MSVNKVILIGRLGDNPQTAAMQNGGQVAIISLATSERWTDQQGQKQEKTEWHRVVFFKRLAEIAGQYLQKGSQIYIEGKLTTRKWQDKSGQDRYTTEVIASVMQMLDSKKDSQPDNNYQQQPANPPQAATAAQGNVAGQYSQQAQQQQQQQGQTWQQQAQQAQMPPADFSEMDDVIPF